MLSFIVPYKRRPSVLLSVAGLTSSRGYLSMHLTRRLAHNVGVGGGDEYIATRCSARPIRTKQLHAMPTVTFS